VTSRVVAIVDPYDAGAMLAPAFAEHGIASVMVGSTEDVPEEAAASFDPTVYAHLLWCKDVDALVPSLQRHDVERVIAGSERGVILADRLGEALGLPGNSTRLSVARRDKARMIEQVARHGIRVPRQIESESLDEIVAWIEEEGGWPAVLKPRLAKGSDGVHLCTSREDVGRAFRAVHGQVDRLGFLNRTVLAQEFLAGPEYVVDTVTHEGLHRLSALWAYGKPAPGFDTIGLLSTKQLLSPEGRLADMLFGFARRVLDALEIRHGAGHCEIIVDENGPVLVEIGARLHGGPPAHLMCRAATGTSQLDLLVQSCVDPGAFVEGAMCRYALAGGTAMALLRDDRLRGQIETLPSAQRVVWNAPSGERQPPVAGVTTLVHANPAVVVADLEIVTGGLECELLEDRASIEAIAVEWRALLDRSRCNRAFSGPTWFLAALDAWPALVPNVIVARRAGEVAGILPLVRHQQDDIARFATLLSDYNDLIVAEGDMAAARRLMIFARHWFPRLELTCMRADGHCALAEGGAVVLAEKKFVCPTADLSDGYEGWLAFRSPGFRRELGLVVRRAARNGLVARRLDPERDAVDPGGFFIEMQRARFGDRSLFLRDPAALAFATVAIPALWREGSAPLFGLWAGERLVGLNICMLGADSLGNWNAGFIDEVSTFSPGMLMADAAVREACRLGLAEFDYLRGLEPYKLRWCSGRREIGRLA